jgi:GNAT superfamily N-acetyltransferase
MSYELTFENFKKIEALFEAFPYDRAWLDSAFREPGRARAFVEESLGGSLILLCLESGDCFMAGEISAEKVKGLLNYVFELEKPQTINYIGLPQAGWSKLIIGQFPEQFSELPRIQLEFDETRFLEAKKALLPLPMGFKLTRPNLALARRIGRELDPDFEEFWPNPEEFLTHGAGFCITQQGQIASVAYSAFAPYRLFEVAIATHQDFRGRGFATFVAAALLEECLGRGYKPHWSAEAENQASRHTGHKLGFGNEQQYMWLKYSHNKLSGKES